MFISNLIAYQFGCRQAIKEFAENKASILIRFVLTFTAAISRNYDQNYLIGNPTRLLTPLIVSLLSSFFIFAIFSMACLKFESDSKSISAKSYLGSYFQFIGLFWLTSPSAWTYAIPVERLFDERLAAIANLSLLGLVSLWRVALIARVLCVVTGSSPIRTLAAVLLPASAEVLIMSFFDLVSRGMTIMGSGHYINSPADTVFSNAEAFVVLGAIWIGGAALAYLLISGAIGFIKKIPAQRTAFPVGNRFTFPLGGIIFLFLIWIGIAIPPQLKLKRNDEFQAFVTKNNFKEALTYLNKHQKNDFSPNRLLFPNPYKAEGFEYLPGLMEVISDHDAEWIRKQYLAHLAILIQHDINHEAELFSIFKSLNNFPEIKNWLETNKINLKKLKNRIRQHNFNSDDAAKAEVIKRLWNRLNELGIE